MRRSAGDYNPSTMLNHATAPGGNETVLLVEPEPETRTLAVFMLGRLGYRVLEARNAFDAIKVYDEYGAPIDLLLTEAVMSRINGHDLADMLCRRNPELKLLFLADSDYERLARRAAARKRLRFLCRPFTMGDLAAKVREALDATGGRVLTAGARG